MWKYLVLRGFMTAALVFLTASVSLSMTDRLSAETQECLGCHDEMPGIVAQWEDSAHWNAGVGCYECHKADSGDADAMDHNGFSIAIIVSPQDCGQCHPKETAEQEASHHAKAGDILNTKDGILGQTIGGEPAVAVGCRQCHGSIVKVNDDGSLDTNTWPNTGIGRVNPEGSRGPARPATHVTVSVRNRPASLRPVASATSAPIIPRKKFTKNPSMASFTGRLKMT